MFFFSIAHSKTYMICRLIYLQQKHILDHFGALNPGLPATT